MPIPETTSAENFVRYVRGKCLFAGRGEAWREVKAWVVALPLDPHTAHMPSISEPLLTWITSGEVEIKEREDGRPWVRHRAKRGDFFLTSAGAPYDCSSRPLTAEPYEIMFVVIGLPFLQRAFEDVFGADAIYAQLRDELPRRKASSVFVRSIGQAIAIHLARNYAVLVKKPTNGSPSLPGYKLRQITDWMADHVADEFNLARLAARVGVSKFHFNRLFKTAMGVAPSRHHITLRMDAAQRLLRETKKSVVEVAIDVGYANPSHFAQLFRRETGLSPSEYRRQG